MARAGALLLALWRVLIFVAVLTGSVYAVASGFGVTVIDLASLLGLNLTEPGRVLLGTGILVIGFVADSVTLRLRLWLYGQKEARLLKLARVRSEGIDLWTRGLSKLTSRAEAETWIAEWNVWHERAVGAASAIAPHEGEALTHLGGRGVHAFPEGRFFGDDHHQAVSVLNDQLGLVDEIRKRHAR